MGKQRVFFSFCFTLSKCGFLCINAEREKNLVVLCLVHCPAFILVLHTHHIAISTVVVAVVVVLVVLFLQFTFKKRSTHNLLLASSMYRYLR